MKSEEKPAERPLTDSQGLPSDNPKEDPNKPAPEKVEDSKTRKTLVELPNFNAS